MSTSSNWVCAKDSTHVYDQQAAEKNGYFCPQCPFGEGILMESQGSLNLGFSSASTIKYEEDLGLCIMLLDCSGSMSDPCFKNSPLSKKQLVARGVAGGIFSLSGNMLKEFAYILILGFDHRIVTLLPYTSVKEIVDKYQDATALENFILDKMTEINGATNINEALRIAAKFTEQFINSEIATLGNYKPRIQTVMDETMSSHQIPNVRVVLFTDGDHYVGDEDVILKPSPFKNLPGVDFDLLICAYYGNQGEKGYNQLKSLASKCPIHSVSDQLFLFDEPSKVPSLKGLFRMASGASGFCPICYEESNKVEFDNK